MTAASAPHYIYTVANPIANHPIIKMFNAIIGDINVPKMIDAVSYLAAFTIIISYLIAVKLGHVEWFPCMITSAGTDYPENILFRIGMISSIFYWVLMIELQYMWLHAQVESLAGAIVIGNRAKYIAYAGFFFYGLTIATIDQGHTPTQIHGACAVFFFVLLCIFTVLNLSTIKKIRALKPDFITQENFNTKVNIAKVWYLVFGFLIALALGHKWGLAVAEWVGTFAIIFYLRTFANDLKGFHLDVDDTKYSLKSQLARNLR